MSSSSASTSDVFVTGEPAPSSGNSNSNTSNATSSSSLYLFTFLATLLLLLVVSCGIVFRSLLIRRRYRRRVEQAIAAGVIPPTHYGPGYTFEGGVFGRRQRDFGAKPEIWDTWVEPAATTEEAKWSEIKPVSVKIIQPPPETIENNYGDSPLRNTRMGNNGDEDPSDAELHPPRRFLAAINPLPFSHRRSPSPSPAASPAPLLSPKLDESHSNNQLEAPAMLEVAVLIAMPSQHRNAARTNDLNGLGEDLPDVVFGVAEVPLLNARGDSGGASIAEMNDERDSEDLRS